MSRVPSPTPSLAGSIDTEADTVISSGDEGNDNAITNDHDNDQHKDSDNDKSVSISDTCTVSPVTKVSPSKSLPARRQSASAPRRTLPPAIITDSFTPPAAARPDYMWLRVPLSPRSITRFAESNKTVKVEQPRRIDHHRSYSMPMAAPTAREPRPLVRGQSPPHLPPSHPSSGHYHPYLAHRRQHTMYQPIPYRFIATAGSTTSAPSTQAGEETTQVEPARGLGEKTVTRRLLLVGPGIAQHLKSGGSVRVKDVEGSVIGWLR